MRPVLILALTLALSACSLMGAKKAAVTGPGDGGITVSKLAAPGNAPPARPVDTQSGAVATASSKSAAPASSNVQVATPATPHPVPRPVTASTATAPASSAASSSNSAAVPQVQVATPDTPHPKPRPVVPGATQAGSAPAKAVVPPPKPKSTLEIRCEAGGGIWGQVGNTGAFICQKKTNDAGKVCHRRSDCEGECLAGNGTCAPVMPLLGCNAVLDNQGRRVTLCLN